MHVKRAAFLALRSAALAVQSLRRAHVERARFLELVRETRAATMVQKHWRGHAAVKRWAPVLGGLLDDCVSGRRGWVGLHLGCLPCLSPSADGAAPPHGMSVPR